MGIAVRGGWAALFCLMGLASCSQQNQEPAAIARPAGTPVALQSSLGLPAVPVPADNPPTAETIALGRRLFYDPRLSADNSIACASCHGHAFAFADPRKVSLGVDGKVGDRNAPTALNAAFHSTQFWDGRAPTLEEQAAGPIANPVEMNQAHTACASRLNEDPSYVADFTKAFGPGPISMDKITKAIASFERTLVSGNSAFDRYQYGGEKSAMSASAIRGLAIFKDKKKGNCAVCHTMEEKFALFTDGKFHNLGVGLDPRGELIDLGRYAHTKAEADRGAFRTPTLRNIARTAPYMHDGSLKTLREVVDFYVGGGSSNPYRDPEIKELELNEQERNDLVAFMQALTGDIPPDSGPPTT